MAVGVEIGKRVRESLSDDPASIGAHAELPEGQARALEGQELLPRAVEGDLLFVTLPAAPLSGDLELTLFIYKSMS